MSLTYTILYITCNCVLNPFLAN